jgi:DNA modification methylase
MNHQVIHGDCIAEMAKLEPDSVDCIVTDPPYDLVSMTKRFGDVNAKPQGPGSDGRFTRLSRGFMGQQWDGTGIAFKVETWQAAIRVLKPGGHLLAFGGTRTYHRMVVAIEDAGFEIRDTLMWLYGTGFPKSLDVSKAIDKANGRKFEDRYALGRHIRERRESLGIQRSEVDSWFGHVAGCMHWEAQNQNNASIPTMADWRVLRERLGLDDVFLPLVERAEAEREILEKRQSGAMQGWVQQGLAGYKNEYDVTAPALSDAERWQGWGTALKPACEPIVLARKPFPGNVAANVLRHGTGALNIDASRIGTDEMLGRPQTDQKFFGGLKNNGWNDNSTGLGRWPANVILDESSAAELDRVSGESVSNGGIRSGKQKTRNIYGGFKGNVNTAGDGGYGDFGGASRFFFVAKASADEREIKLYGDKVNHPTVKPIALMVHLIGLVCPEGGTILDPFLGSGTTAIAALRLGRKVIGIEQDEDYVNLARKRIHGDAPLFNMAND